MTIKKSIKKTMCRVLGHKFDQVDLLMFKIKNSAINVQSNGRPELICPRCKKIFSVKINDVV